MMARLVNLLLYVLPSFAMLSLAKAEPIPSEMLGDWTLALPDGEVGWISLSETEEGLPEVCMLVDVGSIGPLKGVEISD